MVKYNFSIEEKEKVKTLWTFIDNFSKPLIVENKSIYKWANIEWYKNNNDDYTPLAVSSYRNYIIEIIRSKYTYEEFYVYEKILNKLFWKLKNKLKKYVIDNNTSYTIEKHYFYDKYRDYYASKVNSYIQYNQKSNVWYILEKPSKLDVICMSIIIDKKEYIYYYKNPEKIKDYNKIIRPYYYLNFPFPNVNPMFYNDNDKSIWIEKIKKMYYYQNLDNKSSDDILIEKIQNEFGKRNDNYKDIDKYWYELITFDQK